MHLSLLQERIYVFNTASRVAEHPVVLSPSETSSRAIPWTLLWLLGMHHRKHIFTSRRLPSIDSIRCSMEQCARMILWKWLFASGILPNDGADDLAATLRIRQDTPSCDHPRVPRELKSWCYWLTSKVVEACGRQTARYQSIYSRDWTNFPKLAREAIKD